MKELTDLEVCQKIAEIEGEYTRCEFWSVNTCAQLEFGDGANWKIYNPLTDDALCFRLMIKHRVSLFVHNEYYSVTNYKHDRTLARDENPNYAICLAIIKQSHQTT